MDGQSLLILSSFDFFIFIFILKVICITAFCFGYHVVRKAVAGKILFKKIKIQAKDLQSKLVLVRKKVLYQKVTGSNDSGKVNQFILCRGR